MGDRIKAAKEPKRTHSRAGKARKAAFVGAAAVGALAMKAYLAGSKESEISKLACFLQEHLGREVMAYLAGAEAGTIESWVTGEVAPDPLVVDRLRSADEAVRYIVRAYGGETAKSWLFGMNPWLGDKAPASVLRNGDRPEAWKSVVEAAQAFVEL